MMILRLCSSFVAVLVLASQGLATGVSSTTNGVYLAIAGSRHKTIGVVTNEPIRFDDALIFLAFCDGGNVQLAYPEDLTYGVKMKLRSPNGKEISRTALGKRTGSRFDSLHTVTDTRLAPISAWGSLKENPGLGGGRFFFDRSTGPLITEITPKDLFEIKKPGIYILEVQMQMFRLNPQNTNAFHRELFTFPLVTIKIEKPQPEDID